MNTAIRPMLKHLLLATGMLAVSALHAQDDPRSKAVIDKLIAKSKGWSTFEADFSSALVNNASKLNVKQEGNVKVKGKLFRLTLTDNTAINDGKAVYTYSKKSNEVTITDPAEMDKEMDPSKLFTIYEQGFKSQFVEEKKDASGVTDQVIEALPVGTRQEALPHGDHACGQGEGGTAHGEGAVQGRQRGHLHAEEVHPERGAL